MRDSSNGGKALRDENNFELDSPEAKVRILQNSDCALQAIQEYFDTGITIIITAPEPGFTAGGGSWHAGLYIVLPANR